MDNYMKERIEFASLFWPAPIWTNSKLPDLSGDALGASYFLGWEELRRPPRAPPLMPARQESPAAIGRVSGESGAVSELNLCPLWVKSGHPEP